MNRHNTGGMGHQSQVLSQREQCGVKLLLAGRKVGSVVHPKFFFPDPDPTLTLILNPDSNPDPACL